MKTAYISHCLSGNVEENRKSASKWVAWAARLGLAPSATWIVLSGEIPEEEGRELGLKIDCEHVLRSDLLIACGPRYSEGMALEVECAKRHCIPVVFVVGDSYEEAELDLRSGGFID